MTVALIRDDDKYQADFPEASQDGVSDSLVPVAAFLASSPVCDEQIQDPSENKKQLP